MKTYPILLPAENSLPKPPEPNLIIVSENPVESRFCRLLGEEFPLKPFLHRNVIFGSISYFPDISFIDEELNIYLDIEIDEPYSQSGVLTHYIDNDKDNYRNKMFVQNGWHVIRFSEKQILNNPQTCIFIIDFFINQIKSKGPINLPNNLSQISHDGWTKEQSQYFKDYFIRDYYNYEVSIIPQDQLKIVSKFSELDHVFEAIIKKHIIDFDLENDSIYIPYFISEQYLSTKDQSSLIFINCNFSVKKFTRDGKTFKIIPSNDCYPKITINKSKNNILFDKAILKKKINERYIIEKDFSGFHDYYNFAFYGTYNDFDNDNLKFIENLDLMT